MTELEDMKSSVAKSFGMLSIVPPVIATGVVLKTVNNSFKDLDNMMSGKKKR